MRRLSTRAGVARPVRRPRNSSLNTLTAFSMRSSASKRISSLLMGTSLLTAHKGAERLAEDGSLDVALVLVVEDQDRQFRLAAHADGGDVHDAEVLAHHPVI